MLAHGGAPVPDPPPDPDELLPHDVSFEDPPAPAPPGSAAARARQAWARMLRKVFEVDPLRCPRCGTPMEIVAWIRATSLVYPTTGTCIPTLRLQAHHSAPEA